MSKLKKESFFWTSYSDLMTSLFFIMLVLFILVIVLLRNRISEQSYKLNEYEKIEEIKKSINNIDTTYFDYNEKYKKHILKIKASFSADKFTDKDIDESTKESLVKAGHIIKNFIDTISLKDNKIQYLLIIEGQASKDNASDTHNYELSYKRAYTLKKIWDLNKILFNKNCEVLISGSGTGGTMRDDEESLNQRFIIHIIPKPGIFSPDKKN